MEGRSELREPDGPREVPAEVGVDEAAGGEAEDEAAGGEAEDEAAGGEAEDEAAGGAEPEPDPEPDPEDPRIREELLDLADAPGLLLPREPKLTVFQAEGFAFVAYGRSAWVQRLRLGEGAGRADLERAVSRVGAMLGVKGLEQASWWLGERSTPADLADRLLELGLEPDDPPSMTALTIAEPPAGEPSVEVRRVETLEELLQALEIEWAAFEVPEPEGELRRREAEEAWPQLSADSRHRTYLALADGDPVGFGRAVFTPRAAVLLGGATLPQARGGGVYRSIVHARWEEAVERGTPRLLVSAGPQSTSILSGLGFEEIGRVRLLRQHL